MQEIKRRAGPTNRGVPIDREVINQARMARGWTISDLARIAGISITAASRACSNKGVNKDTHRKLAYAFDQHKPDPVVQRMLRGQIDGPEERAS